MTAENAYSHPNYLNSNYSFTGERWVDIEGLLKYQQSNYYRVRNKQSGHIMKPFEHGARKKFVFKLRDENDKIRTVLAKTLFEDFDIPTRYALNGNSGFIWDAF